ncbi:DNA polymerase III subunit delta [Marispirochaeta aestuarii]|uniref:DNA polymerase III subunit delta n=1 Tax=Marispirochaeta aestuarii TaxID=1963862 RepID=UPI0029C70129|nr:DNA polymerase III subunit delta [Marispirochaeta aestuarii]
MSKSIFLLLGPENGEKERFIARLRSDLEKKAGGSLETSSFYPYDTSMADVVSDMRNGSLFASSKLVKISRIEDLKKEGVDSLTEYIASPAPGVTLLLLSDEIGSDPKSPPGKLKKPLPKENVKIFWELFENQKQGWILSYFREKKMGIHQDALELLLDLVDNNTLDLKEACGRLALYYGEGRQLSVEDVESQILHSKEENVFSLFAKIAEGDLAGSLDICIKILESGAGQAVQILGGIIWQFRRLHALRLLLDSNFSEQEALNRVNIRGKRNGQISLQGAANYSSEDLGRILALQARYDGLLRSTPAEAHSHVLSMFFYYAVARKGLEEEPVLP